MRRRILSIITALALCLGMWPPIALAVGEPVEVGTAEELIEAVSQALQAEEVTTIKLTADIEVNHERDNVGITFISPNYNVKTGNIILDCGGHTLTSSKGTTIVMNCASLTIRNGTIKNDYSDNGYTYCIQAVGGTINVEKNAEIIVETNSGTGLLVGDESTANVHGKVSGSSYGVYASWGVVNLYSGAVISGRTNAIKIAQRYGTVNLDDGAKAYLNGGEAIDEITADIDPGTMVICDSHNLGDWDENGEKHCSNCGYTLRAQAKVVKGGTTEFVPKLSDMFQRGMNNDGAIFTLLDDVKLNNGPIYIYGGYGEDTNNRIVLNLNNKAITSSSPAFIVSYPSASLTINGDGFITSSASDAIVIGGSTLTVNDGTITGGINNSGGTVRLRGGTFKSAYPGSPCLSDSTSVRTLLGNEGDKYYAYFDTDGKPLPEYKTDGKSLSGTVVVKECTHYKAYKITDTTHQQYCTACGKLFDTDHVTHSPADGTCTACGYMAKPVSVVVDDGEAVTTTLQEAWKLAIAEGAKESTITLLGDVHENKIGAGLESVPVGKTVTINGNGHSFGKFGIPVNGGTVNVNNCNVDCGVIMFDGTAAFNNCTITRGTGSDESNVKVHAGSVEFTGCHFFDEFIEISGQSATFTDCKFKNTLVLTDSENSTFDKCTMNTETPEGYPFGIGVAGPAKFVNCDINVTNGAGIYIADGVSSGSVKLRDVRLSGDFVAIEIDSYETDFTVADLLYNDATTRYAYYDMDGKAVKPVGEWIEGPVTVKECRESHDIHHVEGTLTHSQNCEYCGYGDSGPEKCNYTTSGETLTCSKCGDKLTVTADPPESLVYDGAAKVFDVTVKRGEETLSKGYTVTHKDNTNAGKALLTVAIGDKQGTYTKEFDITPKALTLTGVTLEGRAYNGSNSVAISAVALSGKVGSDDVSVNTTGLTGTLNGSNAGDYTAVTLPALTLTGATKDNYILTQPSEPVSANVKI